MTSLTQEEYETLRDMFLGASGAQLLLGEHEGSTIKLGRLLLCASDGAWWLDTE